MKSSEPLVDPRKDDNDDDNREDGLTHEEEEEILVYGTNKNEETLAHDNFPRASKPKLIPSSACSAALQQEKQNITYPKVMAKNTSSNEVDCDEIEEEKHNTSNYRTSTNIITEDPPNKDAMDFKKRKESRSTFPTHETAAIKNEVDCDELEESTKSMGAHRVRMMACGTHSFKNRIASSNNITSVLLQREKQHVAYPIARQKQLPQHDGVCQRVQRGAGPVLRGIGKNANRIISHHNSCHIVNISNPGIPTLRGLRKNSGIQTPTVLPPTSPQLAFHENTSNDMGTVQQSSDLPPFLAEPSLHGEESVVSQTELQHSCASDDETGIHMEASAEDIYLDDVQGATDNAIPNRLLVEALPVDEDEDMMEAQPVDQGIPGGQAAVRKAQEKRNRKIAFIVVAIACLVLMVSLAVRVTRKKQSAEVISEDATATAPTGSLNKPLPPMENLELLYETLPEGTRESLYNGDSPQYQAWEWLLNHPNITTYPEWRKKQIFALATFFYSVEGPSWTEETPVRNRWMDATTSECAWVMTDEEVAYWYRDSSLVLGPDSYEKQEWQPCNKNGEIQSLVLNQIFLPADLNPSIPPEIGLLTSLTFLGIAFSQINARLSDLLVPEVIQLPKLLGLNFYKSGITGSIPQEMFLMTDLRHLLIGGNRLDKTIPSEISLMSSLEYLNVHNTEGIGGKLPSELGLMTTLTGLELSWSSFSGTIPTELGSLTNMRKLCLDANRLSGAIPSQLGLLTGNTWLALYQNRLTGSLPMELGLMTNTARLRIWNAGLTGSVLNELGLMTNLVDLRLGNDLWMPGSHNDFTGTLPTKLWELSHLKWLYLPNLPNLHGRVPAEMIMPNLTKLRLSGSPQLSGTISDQVCMSVDNLDFDCSDLLCGCDCRCPVSVNKNNF